MVRENAAPQIFHPGGRALARGGGGPVKEDEYAPVTRAISEEDLVAPEEDVERGPTLEDKRRMLD